MKKWLCKAVLDNDHLRCQFGRHCPSQKGTRFLYYHRATFLQLNTIGFLLPFPHPSIPSELSGYRGNESLSVSEILFEDILPIIHCNSMQKVLNWPFCNFVAMHWATKFKVWVKLKQGHFCTLMEQRIKILVAAMSLTPPPSKTIELWQLRSYLSQNLYMASRISNKMVWIPKPSRNLDHLWLAKSLINLIKSFSWDNWQVTGIKIQSWWVSVVWQSIRDFLLHFHWECMSLEDFVEMICLCCILLSYLHSILLILSIYPHLPLHLHLITFLIFKTIYGLYYVWFDFLQKYLFFHVNTMETFPKYDIHTRQKY